MPVHSALLSSGNSRPAKLSLFCCAGSSASPEMCRYVDAVATEPQSVSPADDGPSEGLSEDALRSLRIQELEEEVVSKDELVTALTVQLEQLAEQLDRLQRSGADRKRSSGGGMPADVAESHKKIVGDLERVVQQWEDMQAGLTLGRIEVQLSELRDFIADRLSGVAALPAGGTGSAFPTLPKSIVMERISVTSAAPEPPVIETAAAEPTETQQAELPSMWESLKSRMLEETPTITAEDVTDVAGSAGDPPPPSPINPTTATPAELETALDERDAYITFLLRKIRQHGAVPPPPDWVSLESVPEDLCRTLEAHSKQLEELLRTAEIELSIERARIGREQSLLRQQQEAIDKQMRRLGLKTLDEQVAETEEVSASDRRWVRFLGLPRGK
jgi:hypothetical protein